MISVQADRGDYLVSVQADRRGKDSTYSHGNLDARILLPSERNKIKILLRSQCICVIMIKAK